VQRPGGAGKAAALCNLNEGLQVADADKTAHDLSVLIAN
jgi:dephospho-CoA kinase